MRNEHENWTWQGGRLVHKSGKSLSITEVAGVTQHGVDSLTAVVYENGLNEPEEVESCQ